MLSFDVDFSDECRMLTSEAPDVSPILCQAMSALQDRPVLFKYTLDEFGTARRTAVVRGFIDALTRGGKDVKCWGSKVDSEMSRTL